MAHFAQINSQNTVTRVIVVSDEECLDSNGIESEEVGVAFCKQLFGQDTSWIQTSYNSNFRKHYAGEGFTYNQNLDAFLRPKPYPSWVLDDQYEWTAPAPKPDLENKYEWDENTLSWKLIVK